MDGSYTSGSRYRMPVHFGPMPGPRQGPGGRPFDWRRSPRRETVGLSFLSDAEALAALTPAPLTLAGDPVVTIEVSYITELEWLAGRGYNTFGVRWPAAFKGASDDVQGNFLAVLWENLADPIISGREELGYSKLYCEIPRPRMLEGRRCHEMSWMGFRFFTMEVAGLEEVDPAEMAAATAGVRNDGLLHYKYMPRTGDAGAADVSAVTLTPSTGSRAVVDRAWRGGATHRFLPATWEDLPTMFHVVNALGGLPVQEYRGAWLVESHGGKDLGDQRTLI